MGRRRLLVGASWLLPTLFATRAGWAAGDAALPPDAPIIYMVSAPDCPTCAAWKQDLQASFESSPERTKLRFVELISPSVRQGPYPDAAWPENLRWIRTDVQGRHPTWGTPLFILVHGNKVVISQGGKLQSAPYGFYPAFLTAVHSEIGMS